MLSGRRGLVQKVCNFSGSCACSAPAIDGRTTAHVPPEPQSPARTVPIKAKIKTSFSRFLRWPAVRPGQSWCAGRVSVSRATASLSPAPDPKSLQLFGAPDFPPAPGPKSLRLPGAPEPFRAWQDKALRPSRQTRSVMLRTNLLFTMSSSTGGPQRTRKAFFLQADDPGTSPSGEARKAKGRRALLRAPSAGRTEGPHAARTINWWS